MFEFSEQYTAMVDGIVEGILMAAPTAAPSRSPHRHWSPRQRRHSRGGLSGGGCVDHVGGATRVADWRRVCKLGGLLLASAGPPPPQCVRGAARGIPAHPHPCHLPDCGGGEGPLGRLCDCEYLLPQWPSGG